MVCKSVTASCRTCSRCAQRRSAVDLKKKKDRSFLWVALQLRCVKALHVLFTSTSLLSPFQRQDDEKFLTDLFAQLTDETTDDDKRHELVTKSSLPFPDFFANFLSGTHRSSSCADSSL